MLEVWLSKIFIFLLEYYYNFSLSLVKYNINKIKKEEILKHSTITKENIKELVDTFYPTILSNSITAPFFIAKLGSDINSPTWQEHLELLANFWSSIALGDGNYNGNPLGAHFNLGLDQEAFKEWLRLFFEAIDKTYEPQAGAFFKERSQIIARNFMVNLGI